MSFFQPGQIILDKYLIEEQIGSGSFSEVYRVTHISLHATRALKILTRQMPGVGSTGFFQCRKRFELEARLSARLNHLNVVRVYDFLEEGDLLALEMEFLPGGSLAKKMRDARKNNTLLPLPEVLQITQQAAEGLGAIHAIGIVHRDLSPNNILFDEHGQAKIADLGLAYMADADFSQREIQGSQAERHPGTPKYMSPEQEHTNGHLLPASDVFALGLILYELLSGKNYKDTTSNKPRIPSDFSIPSWLNKLLSAMLSADPNLRPRDGAAVSQEIFRHSANYNRAVSFSTASRRHSPTRWMKIVIFSLFIIGIPGTFVAFSGKEPKVTSWLDQLFQKQSVFGSTERMSGDFRVAVAEITILGEPDNPNLGVELAQGVYQRLEQTYAESNPEFSVTIWGPDRVRKVKGATEEERAEDANRLTSEIGADILVYGFVDVSQPVWKVTPQFFISTENFYQAAEINGSEQLGAIFSVSGEGETAHRLEFSSKITPRVRILAHITVGLAYLSAKNYDQAIQQFQAIERLPEWAEYERKEILFLLAGNAALSAQDLPLAEESYLRSLQIVPEYSRAWIGLAGVYYLKALQPYNASNNPADTDLDLLEQSIKAFQTAAAASYQPPLTDIATKVNFGLGQDHLMKSLANHTSDFSSAVTEFQAVIDEYADGKNPRVRILAAESHARLGLIQSITGNQSTAYQEYEKAAALLYDDPERQALYQKRADELK